MPIRFRTSCKANLLLLSFYMVSTPVISAEPKTDVRGYYLGMSLSQVKETSMSHQYRCTNPGPNHIQCDLAPGKEVPEFIDLAIGSDPVKSVYQITYEPKGKVDLKGIEDLYSLELKSRTGKDTDFKSVYITPNGTTVRVEHIEFQTGPYNINSYKFYFENDNVTKSVTQSAPAIVPNAKF